MFRREQDNPPAPEHEPDGAPSEVHPLDRLKAAGPVPRRTRLVSLGRQQYRLPGFGNNQPPRILEGEAFVDERSPTRGVWFSQGGGAPTQVQRYSSEPEKTGERFFVRKRPHRSAHYPAGKTDSVVTPAVDPVEAALARAMFATTASGDGDTIRPAFDDGDI